MVRSDRDGVQGAGRGVHWKAKWNWEVHLVDSKGERHPKEAPRVSLWLEGGSWGMDPFGVGVWSLVVGVSQWSPQVECHRQVDIMFGLEQRSGLESRGRGWFIDGASQGQG